MGGKKAPTSIPLTARQLILNYEVGGGEEYYNRFLIMPTWPGEASGVTIGVGYDLGYTTPAQFEADWGRRLPAATFARLRSVLGINGPTARLLIPALADIRVPWEQARSVFLTRTLPRFEALALATFPGMSGLPDDAQGVLVSLVFNRGSSLEGDRRSEMAAIAQAVAAVRPGGRSLALRQIARNIRDMKRLWPANVGLQRRRDAEAGLVEQCLATIPAAERLAAAVTEPNLIPPPPPPTAAPEPARAHATTGVPLLPILPVAEPAPALGPPSPFPSTPASAPSIRPGGSAAKPSTSATSVTPAAPATAQSASPAAKPAKRPSRPSPAPTSQRPQARPAAGNSI
ncbi:hypothetical protein DB346_22960 [Verrucomicrobia bacterium LW23]|nr:hypothetical protein DB346_22960 [Verrucomicrobia bacterium LW23]